VLDPLVVEDETNLLARLDEPFSVTEAAPEDARGDTGSLLYEDVASLLTTEPDCC